MKRLIIPIFCLLVLLTSCGNEKTQQADQEKNEATIIVTVNETSNTAEDKWDELQDGYELAVVNVTITNNKDDSYEFNPNYIFIQYDGQQEYVSDKRPADREVMSGYIIKPGESITGNLCYEIPAGTEYDIYFDDFNLQMELPH